MDNKDENLPDDKADKRDEKKVNDPIANYGNKIASFNSFEEENEYSAKKAAEKDPIIGIKETVELILRVYGFTHETLRERKSSDKIIID